MGDIPNSGNQQVILSDALDNNVGVTKNRLDVDSKSTQDFAARSSSGIQKAILEDAIKSYRFTIASVNIEFSQTVTGTGNVSVPNSALLMNTGASSSSLMQITSRKIHKYLSGEGLLSKFAISLGDAGVVGNIREWGQYNNSDGVFIRLNDTDYEIVIRNNTVETVIPSASWDIPVSADADTHEWFIQFKWLNQTDVNVFYDGTLVFTGTSFAQNLTNPDLPIRYRNENTTNATDITLKSLWATVLLEGREAFRITDGIRDVDISEDNRLHTQASGSPLFEEGFLGNVIDTTSKWTETIVGGATSSVADSTLSMNVTTGATDSIDYFSKDRNIIETIGGFAEYRIGYRFGASLEPNNVREFGYGDATKTNAVFFRLSGSTLTFVTRKDGVDSSSDITHALPNTNFHLYKIRHLGSGKISCFIDNQLLIDFAVEGASLVGDKEKIPFLANYNTGVLAGVPSPTEIHWLRVADLDGTRVTIVGRTSDSKLIPAAMTTDGRLLVSQVTTTPPATTAVNVIEKNSMSGTQDSFRTITNGTSLTISRLTGGAQTSNSGTIVELYEDPSGTGTPLNAIEDIYLNGSSGQKDLSSQFLGDGTRRILLRRRMFSGGAAEVTARYEGFEE